MQQCKGTKGRESIELKGKRRAHGGCKGDNKRTKNSKMTMKEGNFYRYNEAAKTTPLRIFAAPSSKSFLSSILPIAVAAQPNCLSNSSNLLITRTILPSNTSVNLPKSVNYTHSSKIFKENFKF